MAASLAARAVHAARVEALAWPALLSISTTPRDASGSQCQFSVLQLAMATHVCSELFSSSEVTAQPAGAELGQTPPRLSRGTAGKGDPPPPTPLWPKGGGGFDVTDREGPRLCARQAAKI